MAKFEWPPEKAFKYAFDRDLEVEIRPVMDTEKGKGGYNKEEQER